MRIPKSLEALAEHGVIQEVIRPLMSGKEAQIYMVVSEDHYCAAKIYKDAQARSFKNKADYTEGRKVRNSRDQRAIAKGTKYGKKKDEDTWKATEVEMIYRLRDAGVRVPEPYMYIDGVLLMELVIDDYENPAPRLGDLEFTRDEATEIYHHLIQEVVRMLCAGVVHGDLSEFNVLYSYDGPVVIDFPQAINAASNQNARSLLLRDVGNLHRFLQRWVPGARRLPYAEEMWSLYESNKLTPETKLTGKYKGSTGRVDTRAVLSLIGDANRDEMRRREARGESTRSMGSGSTEEGSTAPAAPAPARRREYVVEKPSPRGTGGRGTGGQRTAASGASPRRGEGSPGSPASRGRSDDRRGGSRPNDRRRDGQGPHRGGPPGNKPNKSVMPKRGDNVQASTYVSPEARKTKVKQLTPRGGSESTSTTSENAKRGDSPGGDSPRRRRRRRNSAQHTSPESGARPSDPGKSSQASQKPNGSNGSTGESRRRRSRRRSPRSSNGRTQQET